MILSFSDAKQIAITNYLSSLGFEPDKIRGNDYWYRSPLRGEREASFKVNIRLNVWYDHGLGIGGTIIDLGMRLHECSLKDFLLLLSAGQLHFSSPRKIRPKEEENKIEILTVRDLQSRALLDYLNHRMISDETSKQYCKEVEFSIGNNRHQAVGFQNNSGGFELRNSWFKGSSSPKDTTLILNGRNKLCIEEGFIDFLSLHQLQESKIKSLTDQSDFLILNSLSFITRSLPIIKNYSQSILLLDNDTAGRKAVQMLKEEGVFFKDASPLYSPHKDVNDFLKAERAESLTIKKQNNTKLRPS